MNDRIAAKLIQALVRCMGELTDDNLCFLVKYAFSLLDEQSSGEGPTEAQP